MSVSASTAELETTEMAFERAYASHWADVFRFALAWTNDWASAEDLAQDSFACLWRSRGTLDWSRPMMPWLLCVTRHGATDRARSLRRWFSGGGGELEMSSADRDTWLDVKAAMRRLSHEERAALVATTVLGLTSKEAAVALGVTDGAVRAAVSRGRHKLEAER